MCCAATPSNFSGHHSLQLSAYRYVGAGGSHTIKKHIDRGFFKSSSLVSCTYLCCFCYLLRIYTYHTWRMFCTAFHVLCWRLHSVLENELARPVLCLGRMMDLLQKHWPTIECSLLPIAAAAPRLAPFTSPWKDDTNTSWMLRMET